MSIERGAETLRRGSGCGSTARAASSVRRKGFLMMGMIAEMRRRLVYLLSNIEWAGRCGGRAGSLCDSRCWQMDDGGIVG